MRETSRRGSLPPILSILASLIVAGLCCSCTNAADDEPLDSQSASAAIESKPRVYTEASVCTWRVADQPGYRTAPIAWDRQEMSATGNFYGVLAELLRQQADCERQAVQIAKTYGAGRYVSYTFTLRDRNNCDFNADSRINNCPGGKKTVAPLGTLVQVSPTRAVY